MCKMWSGTIKISKIGESITNSSPTTNDVAEITFFFNGNGYKRTVNIDVGKLFEDLAQAPVFQIQTISESIWLVYTADQEKRRQEPPFRKAVRNIVDAFFIHTHPNVPPLQNGQASVNDVFYQQLSEEHLKHDQFAENYPDNHIQHEYMSSQLLPHQISAVKWMLHRERTPDSFPSEFEPIQRRWKVGDEDDQTFFFNFRTLELTLEPVSDFPIPTGGILADEMGLGKTVEALALILLNQRPKDTNSFTKLPTDDDGQRPEKMQIVLKCLCNKESTEEIVACIRCSNVQHRACVSQPINGVARDEHYICPWCWESESLITAKTTLIVSPLAIKMQWMDEVKAHIKDESLTVCIYEGVQKWRNPKELATYDIVLTDYETMRKEFTYISIPEMTHTLRTKRSEIKHPSPLLSLSWWRICLDEAQMVASIRNSPAKIVAKLESVHRWAITGTPITQSICDLHGLIHFLGCYPYKEKREWTSLADKYKKDHECTARVLAVLRRIMWRTCKSKGILDTLKIPKQTELVHFIEMKDVERINYETIHMHQLKKLREELQGINIRAKLSTFDPSELGKILQPLFKLCLYGTTPYLLKDQKQRLMNPDKILQYLQRFNELEGKALLKKIMESKNFFATLHLLHGSTTKAINCYKDVLKLTDDHDEKFGVDNLFLAHAAHNWPLIDKSIEPNDRDRCESQLSKCELKQLAAKLKELGLASRAHKKCAGIVEYLKVAYTQKQSCMDTLKDTLVRFGIGFNSILEDVVKRYPQIQRKLDESWTKEKVCSILKEWEGNIIHEYQVLEDRFNEIKYFTNNIKPISALDEGNKDKIKEILREASKCHIEPYTEKAECRVCLARDQVEKYARVIFDRHVLTKPTYQETILKSIVRQIDARTKSGRKGGMKKSYTKDVKVFLGILAAIKREFKAYSRLWNAVDNTVTACCDFENSKERDETVEIAREEVIEMEANLKKTNEKFQVSVCHSKYLEHLEKNKELEKCPICLEEPRDRYVMLGSCYHTICAKCFKECAWMRRVPNELECSMCHSKQPKENVFYVNVEDKNRLTDSSSRIEGIVRKVVELKHEDPAVKIVIFSSLTASITELAKQFNRNDISCRTGPDEMDKMVKEFKDPNLNVTCLLLPFSRGSEGLNLQEATHIFLVEPIIDPSIELQAVSRNHRIGQTRKTYIHRFIMKNTVEESIFNNIPNGKNATWVTQECTAGNLLKLFVSTKLEIIEL